MLKKLFFTSLSLLFIGNIHAQSDSSEAAADSVNTEPTKKATKELPLEPERQIELKNPTVTWLSLDISPDGRSIYFDALGDLYKMPIGGGKAEALTQGLAYEVHPRISPDGKSLVYISDKSGSQNIWVICHDHCSMANNDAREPNSLPNTLMKFINHEPRRNNNQTQ